MSTNQRHAAKTSRVPDGAHFASLDALPRAVRRALHEAGIDWSAYHVWKRLADLSEVHLPQYAQNIVIHEIRHADAVERHRFADAYERQYGQPYPARAAGSTMQRYERRPHA